LEREWGLELALSADGARVLVSTIEKEAILVRWFDSRTGRELGRHHIPKNEIFPPGDTGTLWLYWFSKDGTLFGYVTADSRLALVDCKLGKVRCVLGVAVPGRTFPAWRYELLEGDSLLVGSRTDDLDPGRRELALWHTATGQLIRRFVVQVQS